MTSKKELDAIWQVYIEPIAEKILYGNYKKPKTLLMLEKLVKNKLFDLEMLGFYLDQVMPFAPQPIDMIPFASTGVDGTYFAFLTDFGQVMDVENAPIIMYCAADFNFENPELSFTFFAKNILDFVSISIQLFNPYLVYENDPRFTDFKQELLESFDPEFEKERRIYIVEILHRNLDIPKISNLNRYYFELFNERRTTNIIKTKDGFGINSREMEALKQEEFMVLNEEALKEKLSRIGKPSRLQFYRDYGYVFQHLRNEEFHYVFDVIIQFLAKHTLHREAEVLKLDLKKQKAYYLYHKRANTRDN